MNNILTIAKHIVNENAHTHRMRIKIKNIANQLSLITSITMSFSFPNIDNKFELFCLHCNKHGFVGHYNGNVVKSSGITQHIKSNLQFFCNINLAH